MEFTQEQAEEIKKQLFEQVDRLPQENKEQIKEYIKNLDNQQLEEFLKKNKISFSEKGLQQEGEAGTAEEKCIFCEITKGNIPSYKIGENKKSMAILEINPLSKGHSIVLPLQHLTVEKIPKSSLSLAQKIAKKIKKKLKPEDIKIETSSLQGHAFINIIPLYKDVQLKKTKAEESALIQLQKKLETKTRTKRNIPEKQKTKEELKQELSKLPKISFRIP